MSFTAAAQEHIHCPQGNTEDKRPPESRDSKAGNNPCGQKHHERVHDKRKESEGENIDRKG